MEEKMTKPKGRNYLEGLQEMEKNSSFKNWTRKGEFVLALWIIHYTVFSIVIRVYILQPLEILHCTWQVVVKFLI